LLETQLYHVASGQCRTLIRSHARSLNSDISLAFAVAPPPLYFSHAAMVLQSHDRLMLMLVFLSAYKDFGSEYWFCFVAKK
jgi:hypothetical protein